MPWLAGSFTQTLPTLPGGNGVRVAASTTTTVVRADAHSPAAQRMPVSMVCRPSRGGHTHGSSHVLQTMDTAVRLHRAHQR